MRLWVPLSLLASSLAAAAPNPWLESAKAAYTRLDCEKVLADLELANKVPTNDLPSQLAILDYSARCQVALGHRPLADEAFAKMLALDPQVELDAGLSPKILDAFRTAKLRLYPEGFVAFKELPASEGLHRAELVDPWKRVTRVVLGRWNGPARKFDEEPLLPTAGVYPAQVATGAPWYFEARASSGEAVALLGKKEAPPEPAPVVAAAPAVVSAVTPAPAPAPKPPNVARWVTAGAGAAVALVGLGLIGVSATSRSSAERAVWADDAVSIGSRAASEGGWGAGLFFGGAAVITAGFIFTW